MESAKDNPVSARDEIALVHKKNARRALRLVDSWIEKGCCADLAKYSGSELR
jgi:hypothetical protein